MQIKTNENPEPNMYHLKAPRRNNLEGIIEHSSTGG